MNINGFGLLNAMGAILNSSRRDSDYAIARYLVTRMDDISEVSITEIMEDAFVTRSAVRRFCNRMGFSSFSDFSNNIGEATYPSDIAHRDLSFDLAHYRGALNSGIADMFRELELVVNDEMIYELARDIHEHTHVILACANNTSGVLSRFQQELLFAHKFVRVISGSYEAASDDFEYDSNPLLIVVSISGVFARGALPWLEHINVDRCLITASHDEELAEAYEKTYYLNRARMGFDSLGIFGKYGIAYFFDLLSACYLHKYAQERREM